MEQTIVRGGPRDLIAYAWYTIGFRPRECLVLVGLRDPRRRCGVVIRVDLPPQEQRGQMLREVAELLRRHPHPEVVALIVSDDGAGPHPGHRGEPELPHRDLERWLRRELPGIGCDVVDVLAVGPRTYRPYSCDDGCCPAEGLPLSDVAGSEFAAHMVMSGRSVVDHEADLVADVQLVAGRLLPVGAVDREEPVDLVAELRRWRELLAVGADEVPQPARTLAGIRDLGLRDAVMLTLVPGGGSAAQRLLAGEGIGPEDRIWRLPPDGGLAERARRLLASLARVAPAGERAQVLAILAWLAWCRGEVVRGRLLADLALADSPGHRLAALITLVLAAGILPPREPSAAAG